MPERQFDHLLDLRQLFAATSDVVVADGVQSVFLFLPLDRLALAVDDGVGSDDAERGWVGFDDLIRKKPLTTIVVHSSKPLHPEGSLKLEPRLKTSKN